MENQPSHFRWDTHPYFLFPITLKIGMAFRSIADIMLCIEDEGQQRAMQGIKDMYQPRYAPAKSNWSSFRLHCRVCGANVNFMRCFGSLLVSSVGAQHAHEGITCWVTKERPRKSLSVGKDNEIKVSKMVRGVSRRKPVEKIEDKRNYISSASKKVRKDESIKREPKMEPMWDPVTLECTFTFEEVYVEKEIPEELLEAGKTQDSIQQEEEVKREQPDSYQERKEVSFSRPEPMSMKAELQPLLQWLAANKYEWSCEWSGPSEKYLQCLVVVSPAMIQNYDNYNDILSFDIFHNLVTNETSERSKYLVGLFSVVNYNSQVLLAGLAIFSKQTQSRIFEAFRGFFSIHSSIPSTLFTSHSQPIQDAINSMNYQEEKPVVGEHLMNPRYLLSDMQALSLEVKWVKGSTQLHSSIHSLARIRGREEYEMELSKVQAVAPGIIDKLLEERPKAFYSQTGSSFVGLSCSNVETLLSVLQKVFPKKQSISNFVKRLSLVEQLLQSRASRLIMYSESARVQLCNKRIEELSSRYATLAIQRFVENYLKGLREWLLAAELTEDGATVCVLESLTVKGCSKRVTDGKCDCLQMEKTGIGCPHLMLVAVASGWTSYEKLISSRWLIPKAQELNTHP